MKKVKTRKSSRYVADTSLNGLPIRALMMNESGDDYSGEELRGTLVAQVDPHTVKIALTGTSKTVCVERDSLNDLQVDGAGHDRRVTIYGGWLA